MAVEGVVTGGGRALADVVVNDGVHVTTTDGTGRFSLPGEGRFVAVTTPTGWTTARWYHPIDAPALDFDLTETPQPACCFAQVTDLHLSLGGTAYGPNGDATLWVDGDGLHERVITSPGVLSGLFGEVHEQHPEVDLIIATGDLTNTGVDAELAAYVEVVAASPVRVVSIPGNHDHHDAGAAAAAGELLPYERHLGPRWFSFDHGGVHVAAIDWYTHRLGFDTAAQEQWLAADLTLVADDVPIVLLTHDQMAASFYDRLPRRPVLTLSGHWHTTRVVAHAGTLHVNTGPATFGGLDYCPPHYRIVSVGDRGVAIRTVVHGPGPDGATVRAGSAPAPVAGGWIASLDGGGHLAGAVVVGDLVVAAGKGEDDASGRLVAFDAATGQRRWSLELAAAVKATPRAAGDTVLVCTVAGELHCVDAGSGTIRWATWLHDDPLHLWAYLRPLVHDGLVFAGDVGAFVAVELATGAVRWVRDDLGHRENLTTLAHPVVVDGVLVGTFAGQAPAMFALDPGTGATRWPEGGVHNIYEHGGDLATELPRVVVGGITADPDGSDVYVVRLGSLVERLRAGDGSTVWSAPFHGWFNPAAPVVAGDAVVASASTGQVWCYDRATGAHRWTTEVSSDGPAAMGTYRADGASVLAPVLPVGDRLLQPTGDGRIVVLDAESGEVVDAKEVGAPVVAPLARAADLVVAVGVDGWVRALPLS